MPAIRAHSRRYLATRPVGVYCANSCKYTSIRGYSRKLFCIFRYVLPSPYLFLPASHLSRYFSFTRNKSSHYG